VLHPGGAPAVNDRELRTALRRAGWSRTAVDLAVRNRAEPKIAAGIAKALEGELPEVSEDDFQ
jgi:hypothetical protein